MQALSVRAGNSGKSPNYELCNHIRLLRQHGVAGIFENGDFNARGLECLQRFGIGGWR
jgi:hypothetical protein